ncbi:MAG TPA: AraC family transcriptional regulator [Candidatus Limnocylindria bacterium]|nr:AraC family transcriptional regulator [Candidatus Limnocylindria bacterium]
MAETGKAGVSGPGGGVAAPASFWSINRIGDETLRPRHFNETLPFTSAVPYRLTKRSVLSCDDVPLHYASSLEIVLYDGVEGEIVVDGKQVPIRGSAVVVVPPGVVHGGSVTGTEGMIYCLQISLESMSHLVNIAGFLEEDGLSVMDAPAVVPEADAMRGFVADLFDNDGSVFRRCITILRIMETISAHIPPVGGRAVPGRSELKALISWTHEHSASAISLTEAAAVVGFSKQYFCKWFRQNTGVNYVQYIKRIRVYNAGKLLLKGMSVSEAGYESGFQNISYFIKCFREVRGCTPKEFAEAARNSVSLPAQPAGL